VLTSSNTRDIDVVVLINISNNNNTKEPWQSSYCETKHRRLIEQASKELGGPNVLLALMQHTQVIVPLHLLSRHYLLALAQFRHQAQSLLELTSTTL